MNVARNKISYFDESLQIATVNWRETYLLKPRIIKLNVEVDEGKFVYRAKGQAGESVIKHLRKD